MHDFLSSAEHKERYFEERFYPYIKSQWGPKQHWTKSIVWWVPMNFTTWTIKNTETFVKKKQKTYFVFHRRKKLFIFG